MSCGTCGQPAPGTGSEESTAGGFCSSCPHNCITGVRIVDGVDDEGGPVLSDSVEQYVNLPREEQYVDDVTGNIDRLGRRIKIWVEQQLHTPVTFDFRIVPEHRDAGYSPDERSNSRYVHRPSVWAGASGGSYNQTYGNYGTEREVQLTASGGEAYNVEVRCATCGTIVTCGPILAWRRIWYVPIVTQVGGSAVRAPDTTAFKDYFRNDLFIKMRRLNNQEVPAFTLHGGDDDRQRTEQSIAGPYRRSGAHRRDPHAIAVLFVDQLSVRAQTPVRLRNQALNRNTRYLTIDVGDDLWYDIGGENDAWFLSGRFWPRGGGSSVDITQDMLTTVPGSPIANKRSQLRLDVNPLFAELDSRQGGSVGATATGDISLEVYCASGWSNGYAYSSRNYVVLATRAEWEDLNARHVVMVLTHEFGHTMGMTPTDNRGECHGLDPVPTQYTERGHNGNHCCHGVTSSLPTSGRYAMAHMREADCTMFGASCRQTYGNKAHFCDGCADAVKKMDMHLGWHAVLNTG